MKQYQVILHHYEDSPYAEKVRAMFGHGGIRWGSVLSPAMPPRPNLDPLVGGYRRIPVLQMGADLFCDSTLIALELAALAGKPEYRPRLDDAGVAALVKQAQGDAFFSVITSVSPLKLLITLVGKFGLVDTLRFFKDRTKMMKNATIRPPRGSAASQVFQEFLTSLDKALDGRDFLGGLSPAYADFCVYHPVHFKISVSGDEACQGFPNVQRWFAAMRDCGHGDRDELEAVHAFAAAAESEPRALPDAAEDAPEKAEASPLIGKQVSIAPTDYGQDPVTGELVAVTPERFVIARVTDRFGRLHVHFPRQGYSVVEI